MLQQKLDSQINLINFEGKNLEQIETELTNWTNIVKNSMNTAIPKTNYQFICQLKTTPEIRDLEAQSKILKQFATHFGWTIQTFREY